MLGCLLMKDGTFIQTDIFPLSKWNCIFKHVHHIFHKKKIAVRIRLFLLNSVLSECTSNVQQPINKNNCFLSLFKFHFQLLPLPPRFVAFSNDGSSNSVDSLANRSDDPDGNPDPEEDDFGESTELRGTLFWAPPRPQLILKIHKKPRFVLLNNNINFTLLIVKQVWNDSDYCLIKLNIKCSIKHLTTCYISKLILWLNYNGKRS